MIYQYQKFELPITENAEWMFIWHPTNVHVAEIHQNEFDSDDMNLGLDSIYQYRESHCGDKMVGYKIILSPQWDFYTGKMAS